MVIAVASELREKLGCPWPKAIDIAQELAGRREEGSSHERSASSLVDVQIDIQRVREHLKERLGDASEYVLPRKRGRPRLSPDDSASR